MTRVLFVAYYYPPIGGAGAQRPARFAAHLPEHGCEASILTGQGTAAGRWTPHDQSLEAEMPPELAVHRIAGAEPSGQGQPWARVERWLGIDSPWTRWWVHGGVEAGREPAAAADAIYVFMSPWASADLAMRLAGVTGTPWIADLGDPWALDEMAIYPTALHRRADLRRMGRALQSATAVVVTTHEAAVRIRETFPELGAKPIVTIPMGYDAADFVGPEPARSDDAFRIVHTGYLHTEHGHRQRRAAPLRRLIGGQNGSVDILTRSHSICWMRSTGLIPIFVHVSSSTWPASFQTSIASVRRPTSGCTATCPMPSQSPSSARRISCSCLCRICPWEPARP